ncbi:MAG: BolA family transcriptional regulator [Betaproteobacteria bacterium]|nr:BolA family transcriptional regulator [Betaproteobacteria bacterium]MBK9608534.1 BolA family transcriptional regulator [Betaproteobacteria bacterium]
MNLDQTIRARLAPLAPSAIELADDSADHAGHAEAMRHGGGHFSLTVVSEAFMGQSRVRRHQSVYALLSDLIPGHIHALQLRTLTPDEF